MILIFLTYDDFLMLGDYTTFVSKIFLKITHEILKHIAIRIV